MTRIRQALLGAFFVACVFAAGCLPAAAQIFGMSPCGMITLSATTTSSNAQLPACGTTAQVTNTGSVEAFYFFSNPSGTVATIPGAGTSSTGFAIEPGQTVSVSTGPGAVYFAAITASGTTTLRITQGIGLGYASGAGGGSGGSGGTVTDTNSAAFSTATAFAVGGSAVTAGRSVGVYCTSAGTVTFTMSSGGSYTVPIVVGYQTFPFAVTGATATTGTATYANLN